MSELSHIRASGEAHMVDVSAKAETARIARARGRVIMAPGTLAIARDGQAKKGDVFGVARVAGFMAAKKTSDLIPLCHPLPLSGLTVEITPDDALPGVIVEAEARVTGRTGVEMEALTAVSVARLTIYDMLKAVDRGMRIDGVELVAKSGGKSGDWRRGAP
jgi:cyclic pyranopterin phosphate synthase